MSGDAARGSVAVRGWAVPIEFLRRRGPAGSAAGGPPPPAPPRRSTPTRPAIPQEGAAQDYQGPPSYAAKASEGIRLGARPQGPPRPPPMGRTGAPTPPAP